MKIKLFAFATALAFAFVSRVNAQLITINATDQGEYQQNLSTSVVTSNPLTSSIRAGFDDGSPDRLFRNFTVFDLTGLSGTLTSVTLHLSLSATGYVSTDPSETLGIYAVTTSITDLTTPAGSLAATFTDLGDGLIGSRVFTSVDNGATVSIAVDVAYVQSHLGGMFAIGGALTSITGTSSDQLVFANNEHPIIASLDLNFRAVPEPSTYALFGAASLVGMVVFRNIRQKKTLLLTSVPTPVK